MRTSISNNVLAQQLRESRQQLGLSQRDFAQLLGITRPMLAHIELGTRTLPNYAAVRLVQLLMLLQDLRKAARNEKSTAQLHRAECRSLLHALEKQLAALRKKRKRLEQKLTKAQQRYQNAFKNRAIFAALQVEQPMADAPESKEATAMDVATRFQLQKCAKVLKACSLAAQAALKVTIAAVNGQVKELKQLIDDTRQDAGLAGPE